MLTAPGVPQMFANAVAAVDSAYASGCAIATETSYCCVVGGVVVPVTVNAVHPLNGIIVVVSFPVMLELIAAPAAVSSALTSVNRWSSGTPCECTVIVAGAPRSLRNST